MRLIYRSADPASERSRTHVKQLRPLWSSIGAASPRHQASERNKRAILLGLDSTANAGGRYPTSAHHASTSQPSQESPLADGHPPSCVVSSRSRVTSLRPHRPDCCLGFALSTTGQHPHFHLFTLPSTTTPSLRSRSTALHPSRCRGLKLNPQPPVSESRITHHLRQFSMLSSPRRYVLWLTSPRLSTLRRESTIHATEGQTITPRYSNFRRYSLLALFCMAQVSQTRGIAGEAAVPGDDRWRHRG